MNKEYKIKLDLNKKLYNKKMTFNQFDENVNDFYIEVTKNNKVVKDLDKSIITLVAIKPNNTVDAQFIEVKEGQIYADLKPSMCDLVGNYQAKAMIVLEGEIVTTDTINYSVNEDKIISRLNEDVVSDERYTLFTDALARLSTIEISEEQRVINESERILAEENRKIEEAKRVETELIRQHEEADRTKYDAIRESNENIRKQNESIRLSNETNRIDEEAKRVEEENKRKLAEEERKANYDFMTEDEERRRSEANTHKEAENLRVQAETNRVNEEAKRRTTEQARVSAENTRVSNENTREANEEARKNNETQRVEAETQRQNRYNSFIADAEANANEFENYTNTAKVKEEERKANELDRKSQEDRRVSNENERVSSENTRKANEETREENETSRQNVFENKVNEVDEKIVELNTTKDNFISSINTKVDTKISELDTAKSDITTTVSNKVNEVETRFNALTSKQQQDAEVIDARDGEVSLKARLDRDIEKANKELDRIKKLEESTVSTVTTESDFTTVEATSNGYFEDVKLEGKTIKGEGLITDISIGHCVTTTGESIPSQTKGLTLNYREAKPNTEYTISCSVVEGKSRYCYLEFDAEGNRTLNSAWSTENPTKKITTKSTTTRMVLSIVCDDKSISSQTLQEAIDLYKPLIVEGDRVNNLPILYYGLKSVGDGVDEIVVSSYDPSGNLFDGELELGARNNATGNLANSNTLVRSKGKYSIYVEGLTEYKIIMDDFVNISIYQYDKNGNFIRKSDINANETVFTTSSNTKYLGFNSIVANKMTLNHKVAIIKLDAKSTNRIQDKKRLLYYNEETQAWEKPILREWDSIEKHSDGKYYYYQRSAEVVLNGSENISSLRTNDDTLDFVFNTLTAKVGSLFISNSSVNFDTASTGRIYIRIDKTKLSSPDLQGFKQWLQANCISIISTC